MTPDIDSTTPTRFHKVQQAIVIHDVLCERAKQDAKWGEQNHDPFCWLAVLQEEVGEAAKDALSLHFSSDAETRAKHLQQLQEEIIQVTAVALAMLECLHRNTWGVGDFRAASLPSDPNVDADLPDRFEPGLAIDPVTGIATVTEISLAREQVAKLEGMSVPQKHIFLAHISATERKTIPELFDSLVLSDSKRFSIHETGDEIRFFDAHSTNDLVMLKQQMPAKPILVGGANLIRFWRAEMQDGLYRTILLYFEEKCSDWSAANLRAYVATRPLEAKEKAAEATDNEG